MKNGYIDRRTVLRGMGVCMGLPLLESMVPHARGAEAKAPARLAIFSEPFGVVQEKFHPKDTGFDYTPAPTLKPLEKLRSDFTVFSNIDHDVRGGHSACHTFLSGIKLTQRAAYRDGNITVDQRAAELFGHDTRFSSLNFWNDGMSYTRTGVRVPAVETPSDAFALLFIDQTAEEKEFLRASIGSSSSILDTVLTDAKSLQKQVSQTDRDKLDEYFTSVRETERKLQVSADWLDKAKPKPQGKTVKAIAQGKRDENIGSNMMEVWLDLMYLALQTDSARIVAAAAPNCNWGLTGVTQGFHALSHHGMREDKLAELEIIENYMMTQMARFIQKLKDTKEPTGGSMLDTTQVLFGSGLGSGSRHSCENLPLILAGGGFKHGQHIDKQRKVPLCNLYLTMLQQMGGEVDTFNRSNGAISELLG
jgi:hypothetical protein